MGQIPLEPPNVAGWPGGAAWLNSATVYARLNTLNQLTGGAPVGPENQRPAAVAPQAGNRQPRKQQPAPAIPSTGLGNAAQALAHYLPLVLDDNIPDEARQLMLDYAGGPEAPLSATQLRGLVYLVLGSPQFHLS